MDRRIKIRHLQAFVEISRQKSLKRAAEVLHLTQPAISKTLKELEEVVEHPSDASRPWWRSHEPRQAMSFCNQRWHR